MSHDLITTDDYRTLIADLKTRIRSAQIKAALAVNTQLIALYWDIGKLIAQKQRASGWGDAVIEAVAKDLSREFQTMKGFSRANLYRMKRFYTFYTGEGEFVPQAVAQTPFGHSVKHPVSLFGRAILCNNVLHNISLCHNLWHNIPIPLGAEFLYALKRYKNRREPCREWWWRTIVACPCGFALGTKPC